MLRSGIYRLPGDTRVDSAQATAQEAYEKAGIGPDDLDVVELHDAMAPAELMLYERLGLCRPGEGPRLIDEGITTLTGRVPASTSPSSTVRSGSRPASSGAPEGGGANAESRDSMQTKVFALGRGSTEDQLTAAENRPRSIRAGESALRFVPGSIPEFFPQLDKLLRCVFDKLSRRNARFGGGLLHFLAVLIDARKKKNFLPLTIRVRFHPLITSDDIGQHFLVSVTDMRWRIGVIDRRGDKIRLGHFVRTNCRTNACRASAPACPGRRSACPTIVASLAKREPGSKSVVALKP